MLSWLSARISSAVNCLTVFCTLDIIIYKIAECPPQLNPTLSFLKATNSKRVDSSFMILYHGCIWRWKKSLDGAVLNGRTHSVLWSGFEAIVPILLQRALHDVNFKEVPHFLSEKDFLLDLHGIAQVAMLPDLATGLQPGLVEHVVVAHKGLHHGLEQATVEHQCWSMHKPHFNHHYKHHPSRPHLPNP